MTNVKMYTIYCKIAHHSSIHPIIVPSVIYDSLLLQKSRTAFFLCNTGSSLFYSNASGNAVRISLTISFDNIGYLSFELSALKKRNIFVKIYSSLISFSSFFSISFCSYILLIIASQNNPTIIEPRLLSSR